MSFTKYILKQIDKVNLAKHIVILWEAPVERKILKKTLYSKQKISAGSFNFVQK